MKGSSPLTIAEEYCDRGWSVVPVPFRAKRPIIAEWEKLRLKPTDLPDYFNGKPMNVGVNLGEPSGGLVDVDLDSREAIALAPRFLPPTGSIFGRKGKPASHRLYYCHGVARTMQFSDVEKHPEGQRLVELRSNGGQTIFPGSTHESGEAIDWECIDDPAEVPAEALITAVRKVAAGSIIARHWPGEGERHTTAMALSAVLLRSGMPVEDVETFVEAIAEVAHDEEVADRVRTVRDTDGKLSAGEKVTGWPTFMDKVGERVAAKVADWLNIDVRRERGGSPAERSTPQPDIIVVPEFRSARELIQSKPKLREPLIHGWLRRTETMNVIGPSKTMKSYFVTYLQLSVACRRMLFGRYQVRQGDVLNLDNELHAETSASRIRRVADAMGLGLDDYGDRFYVDNLRGRLRNLFQMGSYFDALEPGRWSAIVLDAAYRFLPEGADENDNGLWTNIYNLLDSWAEKLQTSFIVVHHSSKGAQGAKSVTDVGSGAGAMSRAADTHLIIRHHEESGAVVVDAALRSFEPIEPFCLRWEHPLWVPAPDLDPSRLKRDGSRVRQNKPTAPEESKAVWSLDTFVQRFVDDKPRTKSQIVIAASEEGISDRKAGQFLEAAEAAGKLHRWTYRRNQPIRFASVPQPVTATGDHHE